MQQFALIENIQREDLNPIELAKSYEALIKLHGVTHEELSNVIHKSRTHITNTLRLLNLSSKTQQALVEKKISAGHAKVLVGLDDKEQTLMVNSIVGQKLSVREVENIIKSMKNSSKNNSKKEISDKNSKNEDELYLMDLSKEFNKIGIKSLVSSKKIILEFKNQAQIDKLTEILK
jgi:ParB family chromosome partitioning protein